MDIVFIILLSLIIFIFIGITIAIFIIKKVILNLGLNQLTTDENTIKILDREKSIFLRHRNNDLTGFEKDKIKPFCSEELFKYYYFICPTENFWKDISTRLNANEKIEILTVSHNIDFETPSNPMNPILTVITDRNRVILFSVNPNKIYEFDINFYTDFCFDDIKEIGYEIQPKMTQILRHAIPVEAYVKLKDNNEIKFPCSANIIETIVDKIPDRNLIVNGLLKAEIQNLKSFERQLNELNKLRNEDEIEELEFDMLQSRVYKTSSQIYQEIYEERSQMYLNNKTLEL